MSEINKDYIMGQDSIEEEVHLHTHTHANGEVHTHEHTHEHEHSHDHEHIHEHGHSHDHEHTHEHGHSHGHGHVHSHEHTKAVLNRMSRAIGHMEAIKRMIEEGRDCSEVLIQLAAVKSAINNTGKVILQDHIEHCIVDAIENHDQETINELYRAIDKFIK